MTTEEVRTVLKFGFEGIGLNRISADLFYGNDYSQKILCPFINIGTWIYENKILNKKF